MSTTGHMDPPSEPTITFDNGVTLTRSQYDEYIEQQLAWVESLPPISPNNPWYEEWAREEDADESGKIELHDNLNEEARSTDNAATADLLVQQSSHSPK